MTDDTAALPAVLAAIDEALAPVCHWCVSTLDPAGPSALYCSEQCQRQHQRQTSEPLVMGYELDADDALAALRPPYGQHRQMLGIDSAVRPARAGNRQPDPVTGRRDYLDRAFRTAVQVEADALARSARSLTPMLAGGQLDPVILARTTDLIQADLAAMLGPSLGRLDGVVLTAHQFAAELAKLAPPKPVPPRSALVRAWLGLAPTLGQVLHLARRIGAAIVDQLATEVRALRRLPVRAVRRLGRWWS
ncbi:hypothetical protein [Crossiella sp. CA198]|uniref:hypothetical protein n=1 Tax=Crossiella sp. CA198 TaxID=3455607 RepID=UPI003F8D262E